MAISYKNRKIFDPLYGLLTITPVEWEIIHSPFYQRLRWIKQLGFSSFVFPGAEHSRFGHSIGVMHNCHRILQTCQMAVSYDELSRFHGGNKDVIFHQELRLAALMHDLGTFPFSHTIEGAYLRQASQGQNHEDLGQQIIKNTNYPFGITSILEKYGFDPKQVSALVAGESQSIFANQVLHSEVDCDRMDYLLRDAHYTGLRYGSYDRDYLLHHFAKVDIPGGPILAIKENAIHSVEDFLMARFTWYGQVVRSQRGAKYDFMAEEIYSYFLSKNYVYSFDELIDMVVKRPNEFYQFNDSYFINKLFEYKNDFNIKKNTKILDLIGLILGENNTDSIVYMDIGHQLLDQDDHVKNDKIRKKIHDKMNDLENEMRGRGNPHDWILKDIPTKNIVFVKSFKNTIKSKVTENVLLERDPVKILCDDGTVKLLGQYENSIISKLQNTFCFTPNIYCSKSLGEYIHQKRKGENIDS